MELNPYESPAEETADAAGTYYRVEFKNLSIAEIWRICRNPLSFALGIVLKLLRATVPAQGGVCFPVELVRRTRDELPPYAAEFLLPAIDAWQERGMRMGLVYSIPMLGKTENYVAVLLSADKKTFADVTYVRMASAAGKTKDTKANACWSKFPDGSFFGTTTHRAELARPPAFRVVEKPGSTIDEINDFHRRRLQQSDAIPLAIDDPEMEAVALEVERIEVQHQIDRGVMVPMTPKEIAALDPSAAELDHAEDDGAFWLLAPFWLGWPVVALLVLNFGRHIMPPQIDKWLLPLIVINDVLFVGALRRRKILRRWWMSWLVCPAIVAVQLVLFAAVVFISLLFR
jgi:hypothetical protein